MLIYNKNGYLYLKNMSSYVARKLIKMFNYMTILKKHKSTFLFPVPYTQSTVNSKKQNMQVFY